MQIPAGIRIYYYSVQEIDQKSAEAMRDMCAVLHSGAGALNRTARVCAPTRRSPP
jgi:hypothetical protein